MYNNLCLTKIDSQLFIASADNFSLCKLSNNLYKPSRLEPHILRASYNILLE